MAIYTFPSDDYIKKIYQNKIDEISFDNYYYTHIYYKKICENADIKYLEDNKNTINIHQLCIINDYLEHKLDILKNTKLYTYNYKYNRYEWFHSDDTKYMIDKVKKCIKYIKKIK